MSPVTRRFVLASAVFAATLAALPALSTMQSTAALTSEDKAAIAEAVAGIGLYADLREWDRVKSYFTTRVTTDYTSLFGGEAATSDRDALIAQWQGLLPGFDATQHLITNIVVEGAGNDAVAPCPRQPLDRHAVLDGRRQLYAPAGADARRLARQRHLDPSLVRGGRPRRAGRRCGPGGGGGEMTTQACVGNRRRHWWSGHCPIISCRCELVLVRELCLS
ncbi:MAG: nuclear transport factor 2 family protein [Mesorhizobium sp.]|nr:MAG: nuclear transport factor 2 family protein [Mesorhizobium sp.]